MAAIRGAAGLAVILVLAGCASGVKVYSVRGEVYYKGKPAQGATVHLHSRDKDKTPPAFATVQADGSFHLSTFADRDGAAAGEYAVTITWRDEKTIDGETRWGPDKMNDRYARAEKSGLSATIKPGDNALPRFDLK